MAKPAISYLDPYRDILFASFAKLYDKKAPFMCAIVESQFAADDKMQNSIKSGYPVESKMPFKRRVKRLTKMQCQKAATMVQHSSGYRPSRP
jgi:hypothetical protein